MLSRLAGLALGLLPGAAGACEIALVLAVDVSASVDAREYRLQMDGLAEALVHPSVVEAVAAQPGGVALAAYEWSGRQRQTVIAPWTVITSRPGLARLADAVAAHPRGETEFPTAIGYALGYGAVMLREAPPCRRRAIDVSGDGVGNDGFPPDSAYRAFDFAGVTVNGLAVTGAEPGVVTYYREEVAYGPGAFVEVAAGFEDFARAMRRKLLRELAGASLVSRE